jgi:hypothetical protein
MCVLSMVMEHKWDEWNRRYPPPYTALYSLPPTLEEINEFRRLLDRAREYDRRNGEPDARWRRSARNSENLPIHWE